MNSPRLSGYAALQGGKASPYRTAGRQSRKRLLPTISYVPRSTLALSSRRLPVFNPDRDPSPLDRFVEATFDQAQTVRRRLAYRLHLSDRCISAADAVRRSFAHSLSGRG